MDANENKIEGLNDLNRSIKPETVWKKPIEEGDDNIYLELMMMQRLDPTPLPGRRNVSR